MLIRLVKKTVLSVALISSLGYAYDSLFDLPSKDKIVKDVKDKISVTTSELNATIPATLSSLIEGYVKGILNLKITCVNPVKINKLNVCENVASKGNFLGLKKFTIDLGICKVTGEIPNASGKKVYNTLYSNVSSSLCDGAKAAAKNVNKTIEASPVSIESVNISPLAGISYKSSAALADTEEIKYPSGYTHKTLYGGDNVGYFAYVTKRYKNSSTAKAYLNNKKETLVLKDLSLKSTGKDNENAIKLPKNKNEVDIATNAKAQMRYTDPMVDYSEFMDFAESNLTAQFLSIPVNEDTTLAQIEEKENEIWKEFIQSDEVQDYFKQQEDMIKSIFTDIFTLETTDKDYVFDPSQARLNLLVNIKGYHDVNKEKYKSLIQMTKTTMLKGIMGQTIKYQRMLLNIALKKAKIAASPFREDLAVKDLQKILQTVDNL